MNEEDIESVFSDGVDGIIARDNEVDDISGVHVTSPASSDDVQKRVQEVEKTIRLLEEKGVTVEKDTMDKFLNVKTGNLSHRAKHEPECESQIAMLDEIQKNVLYELTEKTKEQEMTQTKTKSKFTERYRMVHRDAEPISTSREPTKSVTQSKKQQKPGQQKSMHTCTERYGISTLPVKKPIRAETQIQGNDQFQQDYAAIAEACDVRNALEKHAYSMKESVEKNTDKVGDDERNKILAGCKGTIEWLDNNQDAGADKVKQKKEELDKLYDPFLQRLLKEEEEREKQKEEEKKQIQKLKSDLMAAVAEAETKVNEKRFENQIEYKTGVLQTCERWRDAVKDKPDATKAYLENLLTRFQNYCTKHFETMEKNAKIAEQEELKLRTEAKKKLEECLDDINRAACCEEYAKRLSHEDSKRIENYVANAYSCMEFATNISKEEFDNRRKVLEDYCFPILNCIERQIQQDEANHQQIQDALRSLQESCYKVSKTADEFTLQKYSERDSTIQFCYQVSKLISNGQIKTIEEHNGYQQQLSTLYQEMKETKKAIEKKNEESMEELKSVVKECETLLNNQSKLSEKETKEFMQKCRGIRKWIESNPNTTKSDCDSKKKSILATNNSIHQRMNEVARDELNTLQHNVVTRIKNNMISENVDMAKLHSECIDVKDWIFHNPNASKSLCEAQISKLQKIEKDFHTLQSQKLDTTTNMKNRTAARSHDVSTSSYLSTSTYEVKGPGNDSYENTYLRTQTVKTKQTEIDEAKDDLKCYAKDIRANLGAITSLSSLERRKLLGKCSDTINWVTEKKARTLSEIKRKKMKLKDTCEICGIRSTPV